MFRVRSPENAMSPVYSSALELFSSSWPSLLNPDVGFFSEEAGEFVAVVVAMILLLPVVIDYHHTIVSYQVEYL